MKDKDKKKYRPVWGGYIRRYPKKLRFPWVMLLPIVIVIIGIILLLVFGSPFEG